MPRVVVRNGMHAVNAALRLAVKFLCFLADALYIAFDLLLSLWRREKRETPFHVLFAQYYGENKGKK
ncbi:MAG: hypothetical protein [Siphoviridae sp. ctpQM7]|nr:MAG: hypothetical protein [Siphoviridae sp. ctpQM7]